MHMIPWIRDSIACPTLRARPLAEIVRLSGSSCKEVTPYSTQTYYACVIYFLETSELIEYQEEIGPKPKFDKVGANWVRSTSGFGRRADLSLEIVIKYTEYIKYLGITDTLLNVEELGCPTVLIVYESAPKEKNRPKRIMQQGDWECGYISTLQIVLYNPYLWDNHKKVLPKKLLELLIRLRGGEACLQAVLDILGIEGKGKITDMSDVFRKLEGYSRKQPSDGKKQALRVPGMLDTDGTAKWIGELPIFERKFETDVYNKDTTHNLVTNTAAKIFRYTESFEVSRNLNLWEDRIEKPDEPDEPNLKLAMYVISTLNHFAVILCNAPWKAEGETLQVSSLDSNKTPAIRGTLDIIAFYTKAVEKPDWSDSLLWEPRILDKEHDSNNMLGHVL